jgi:hypothetical protein
VIVCLQISCKKDNDNSSQEKITRTLNDGFYTIYFDSIYDKKGNSYLDYSEYVKKQDGKLFPYIFWRNNLISCEKPFCDTIDIVNNNIICSNFKRISWISDGSGQPSISCDFQYSWPFNVSRYKISNLFWDPDNKLNGYFEIYNSDTFPIATVKTSGHFKFLPE